MRSTNRLFRSGCAGALLLGAALLGAGQAAAADPNHDERALAVARKLADALAGAQALTLSADIAYDAVQEDGQTVEFGATRHFAIRRPDRAQIVAVDRGGERRRLVYDGRRIVFVDEAQNVYASSDFTGDLDAMRLYARDELGLPTPLGELLSKDLYGLLAGADSARWVDAQTLAGVDCDHVVFRNAETSVQIWVPSAGPALPRRIVIDYETAPGRPQFRADLRDWDLAPEIDDETFAFTPAVGAERIQFRSKALTLPANPLTPKEGE